MKKEFLFGVLFISFLITGCVPTTQFLGSPKIIGGRAKCEEICSQWDMKLAGMVSMGEYSDGCICSVRDINLSINDIGKSVLFSSALSAGAGAVGVSIQMQREQEAQQQQFLNQQMLHQQILHHHQIPVYMPSYQYPF